MFARQLIGSLPSRHVIFNDFRIFNTAAAKNLLQVDNRTG